MRFTKIHGAGNDFIIIDNFDGAIPQENYGKLAAHLCQRRVSIGADGLMIVEKPTGEGDLRMAFYNSDGSRGEMCGNGARCISRYGHEKGLGNTDEIKIETDSGLVTGRRLSKKTYTVRLADPTVVELYRKANAGDEEYGCSYIELGTPGLPHAVFLVENWQNIPRDRLKKTGRKLRSFKGFPKGANVTFCDIVGPDRVSAVTYERGVEDFTLACGTGCGATVAALTLRGLVSGRDVTVSMPGGELRVTLESSEGRASNIMLTGPTCVVAQGEIIDERLDI